MKTVRTLLLLPLCVLAACDGSDKPTPDAGVDKSCGLDCVAQQEFGLTIGTCFEYSRTTAAAIPSDLGVEVGAVETLEGGVSVLPLVYKAGGLTKMTDYLSIRDGALYLVRRSFPTAQSVTYKDAAGAIVGIKLLEAGTQAGNSFSSQAMADVNNAGTRPPLESTTLNVTALAASASELKVPYKTYEQGVKLLFGETPGHGLDPRRVFVGGTGFTIFASPFSLTGGTAEEFRLQTIRQLASGAPDCGSGSP